MKAARIMEFEDSPEVVDWLKDNLSESDAALLKGSHGLRMDRIVAALEESVVKQVALALSLAGLAFVMTVIWGGPLLRFLRHFRVGRSSAWRSPVSMRSRWELQPWAA